MTSTMATSFDCSQLIKMSPTPPNACSIPPPKAAQNPRCKPWHSSCLSRAAVASFVISSSLLVFLSIEEGYAFLISENNQQVLQAEGRQRKGVRWSEWRSCPQWRTNALENIVPENLPRPSDTRRRSNSITIDHGTIPSAAGLVPGDHMISTCFFL